MTASLPAGPFGLPASGAFSYSPSDRPGATHTREREACALADAVSLSRGSAALPLFIQDSSRFAFAVAFALDVPTPTTAPTCSPGFVLYAIGMLIRTRGITPLQQKNVNRERHYAVSRTTSSDFRPERK